MKKLLYTLMLGVAGIASLCACSDSDSVDAPLGDVNSQKLSITAVETTSTSFTFSVEAKDPDIPYVCLYADKATIDAVPKGDLPQFLMDQLKAQAKSQGKIAADYIAEISVYGNIDKKLSQVCIPAGYMNWWHSLCPAPLWPTMPNSSSLRHYL